jgi:peroxiredoxin Q/BCP
VAGTDSRAPTAAAGTAEAARFGQHGHDGLGDEVADDDRDHADQEHVRAQRGHAAVGEEQRLQRDHHGQADDRGPGAHQHRGERPAHQVPRGTDADREVQHLDREDERDTRPAMGAAAVDSASSTRARRSETPTAAAAATPVAMEVVTSRNPSGTCTGMLLVGRGACRAGGGRWAVAQGDGDLAPSAAQCETATVSQLTPGDRAPTLVLPAADGSTVSLADLLAADRGRSVVVYFYPAAMTAGCTTQACDFRDSLASLRGAGYEVLGVSPDPVDVLREFAERDAVPYPLLSDPDRSTMTAWGAWGEKTLYGKPVTG